MTDVGSGGHRFVRPDAPSPYCKGCGHAHVLRALDAALGALDLAPANVVVVTDIGCVGLADAQIDRPNTVHTTHGRSTAFATGIAAADAALATNGRLKTIVMIGDGGSMIGLNHIVFAALLNVDVTVLIHNNFLFGMTGGQNSALSPLGFVTSTTKSGNAVPPLDVCRVLLASRAPFVARAFATDRDLASTIARAVAHPGFAAVEVLELCTAHGTRWNTLSASRMRELAAEAGYEVGVLRDEPRPTALDIRRATASPGATRRTDRPPRFEARVAKRVSVVLAGTAGERVQSAAGALAEAGLLCGLHVTQKNDNPVTQGTGFSVSEVNLSPEPILYTGIERPDGLLVVSSDGLGEITRSRMLQRVGPGTLVVADEDLPFPDTPGTTLRPALRRLAGAKHAAIAAVAAWMRASGLVDPAALQEALDRRLGPASAEVKQAISKTLPSER